MFPLVNGNMPGYIFWARSGSSRSGVRGCGTLAQARCPECKPSRKKQGPPLLIAGLAQLVERSFCKQVVVGSIPTTGSNFPSVPMSMFSDAAIESQLNELLAFMRSIKDKPPEQQLVLIDKHINETIEAAKSGWL